MRLRHLLPMFSAVVLLAGCTPPQDSPTRGSGAALEVQLSAPRTCLNGRCISYIPTTGNVFAPDRVTIAIPRGMVGPDRFMSAQDFNRLLRLANDAPHINDDRFSF